VDGTETDGVEDIEAGTPVDTTGTPTTTPVITDGTAVGDGLLVVTIRGFCRFLFRFLTLTTADMDMDTVQGTGTHTN
jgi:hypothetical protein